DGSVELSRRTAALRLGLDDLDLSALDRSFRGHAAVHASVSGPLGAPTGQLDATLHDFAIAGDPYDHAGLVATLDKTGIVLDQLRLERRRGGGLAAGGRIGYDRTLDLHFAANPFPLRAIPQVTALPVYVAGDVTR